MAAKRKRVKLITHDEEESLRSEEDATLELYKNYMFRTKLDAELLSQICILLEEGLPIETACEYIGISVSTHQRWLVQGRQYVFAIEEGNDPPRPEWKLYAVYLIEVRKAIATYLREKIENVNGAFTPSWVRDITILERRDYKNWGRNVTVTEREETKNPDESFL